MSLYNRNLSSRQSEFSHEAQEEHSFSARATFVKQTYQLLSASLLAATVGAYIGVDYVKTFSWMLLILELGMLFGLFFTRKNPTLALVLLFGFTSIGVNPLFFS